MLENALFAWLHFLGAFGVVITLSYEWIAFERQITLETAKKIQLADIVYGLSAIVVLVSGFLRLYLFEKGSAFYFANIFFYVKMAIFSVVGIASIYPTVRFAKWKKITRQGKIPRMDETEFVRIRNLLRIEMIAIVVLILSASLMAKGIGY